ncbi:uncharacterized protein AB675_7340 [Cyphellophora attinorum]|uniref:Succinylglutamate desuccinylase/Aspartoacylase catalytic domain-containing protein n=1 Tax=Cyphellophora attinorum TaxID=1664694 RepID=A0A0N1GZ77_9EURO|nr:uncharacterized protein AB675_7340 [Phialophora attinorum]KPI36364.1 hypothetical protein AB675_7340 [Phialophora attinorum]
MRTPSRLAAAAAGVLAVATLTTAEAPTTGDIYQGYPVLDLSSPLDLSSVPANTISRYYINAATGQGNIPYYLPVLIARGSNSSLDSGKKLSLSSSIHGDELNGIPVVHRVFSYLNSSGVVASGDFNGTVIGLPQQNPNGNFHNARQLWSPGNSGTYVNLNRILPGIDPFGESAAEEVPSITDAHVGSVWYGLWGNTSNVDVAVDLHTLSSGANGPIWAYADYRAEYVQRLAELAQPDIIKIDPGEPGSVETTFVDYGIPAITLEIGPAKRWNNDLIDRAEEFVYRLMADLSILPNSTAPEIDLSETYKGTNFSSVVVSQTGWVNMTVSVLDDVEEGQQLAVVYDWFGDEVESVTAPVRGGFCRHRWIPPWK